MEKRIEEYTDLNKIAIFKAAYYLVNCRKFSRAKNKQMEDLYLNRLKGFLRAMEIYEPNYNANQLYTLTLEYIDVIGEGRIIKAMEHRAAPAAKGIQASATVRR